ncbi:hypothetical protein HDU67_005913 [Dinochytrium kinnereticum]|nr:hypothetical protein HDU67_005913 [Dinochytrium kinnereticum]
MPLKSFWAVVLTAAAMTNHFGSSLPTPQHHGFRDSLRFQASLLDKRENVVVIENNIATGGQVNVIDVPPDTLVKMQGNQIMEEFMSKLQGPRVLKRQQQQNMIIIEGNVAIGEQINVVEAQDGSEVKINGNFGKPSRTFVNGQEILAGEGDKDGPDAATSTTATTQAKEPALASSTTKPEKAISPADQSSNATSKDKVAPASSTEVTEVNLGKDADFTEPPLLTTVKTPSSLAVDHSTSENWILPTTAQAYSTATALESVSSASFTEVLHLPETTFSYLPTTTTAPAFANHLKETDHAASSLINENEGFAVATPTGPPIIQYGAEAEAVKEVYSQPNESFTDLAPSLTERVKETPSTESVRAADVEVVEPSENGSTTTVEPALKTSAPITSEIMEVDSGSESSHTEEPSSPPNRPVETVSKTVEDDTQPTPTAEQKETPLRAGVEDISHQREVFLMKPFAVQRPYSPKQVGSQMISFTPGKRYTFSELCTLFFGRFSFVCSRLGKADEGHLKQ